MADVGGVDNYHLIQTRKRSNRLAICLSIIICIPYIIISNMNSLQAIKYTRGHLDVLDQLRLPHEHHYDAVSTCEEAFDCIKSMRVRGAPAIAIVAALALAVELHRGACSKSIHYSFLL